MIRKIRPAVAACALALAASTSVASAAFPAGPATVASPPASLAQQAGISTLQSLGLLSAVAKGGIEVVGVGTVPYEDVLTLHRTMPELFQTGGVTVVVPGVGDVPATWCNV